MDKFELKIAPFKLASGEFDYSRWYVYRKDGHYYLQLDGNWDHKAQYFLSEEAARKCLEGDISITKVLIATSKAPIDRCKTVLIEVLKQLAETFDVKLIGLLGQAGPDCYNLALSIEGENWEQYTQAVTWALMPARYCLCTDEINDFTFKDLN